MKIKLRDLTEEQYKKWQNENCYKYKSLKKCKKCFFNNIGRCDYNFNSCWIKHKDLYSEKFLNQEIEIEPILTEEEREYLSAVIKPFRNKVVWIKKQEYYPNNEQYIKIEINKEVPMTFPLFELGKYYKNMEAKREYTLEELGL